MSRFLEEETTCPHCGDRSTRSVARSINGGRSPHLRQAILDGVFQRIDCEQCGKRFEIGHSFVYIDFTRHQWFQVFAGSDEPYWRHLESVALAEHALCAGPDAPALARQLGANMQVRAVFGVAGLREKLICADAGIDDATLETLKFHMGPAPDDVPLSHRNHLRLIAADDQFLTFLLGGADPAQVPKQLELARSEYDEVVRRKADLGPLHLTFSSGPYVDLGRILVVEAPLDGVGGAP